MASVTLHMVKRLNVGPASTIAFFTRAISEDTDALNHVTVVIGQESVEVGLRITVVRAPTGEVIHIVVSLLTGLGVVTGCIPLVVALASDDVNDDLAARLALLAGAQSAAVNTAYEAPKGTPTALTPLGELFLPLEGLVDVDAERTRITKELEKMSKEIAKSQAKLSNASFVDRAPAAVVEQERARLAEWETKTAQLQSMLSALS